MGNTEPMRSSEAFDLLFCIWYERQETQGLDAQAAYGMTLAVVAHGDVAGLQDAFALRALILRAA